MAVVKNNGKLFNSEVTLTIRQEEKLEDDISVEVVQTFDVMSLEVESEIIRTDVSKVDNFEQFLDAQLKQDVVEDEVVIVDKKSKGGRKKKAK